MVLDDCRLVGRRQLKWLCTYSRLALSVSHKARGRTRPHDGTKKVWYEQSQSNKVCRRKDDVLGGGKKKGKDLKLSFIAQTSSERI